ncbi:hypothetical protein P171DRAFT_477645 [Karstenula rhodostoma CBS 690.94]|uniref:Uncharacterized protein n=1 Tax=Karstenula rhodostoma CBS 690.94 TaxID=1392251 RepID=A0A9P4U4S0_9PLEO|nr:hypothetical protein P171DRAFT_477645 [Karstenula rhodostoma CBS 690.94]
MVRRQKKVRNEIGNSGYARPQSPPPRHNSNEQAYDSSHTLYEPSDAPRVAPSNRFTTQSGIVKNGHGDVDIRSAFGKLHTGSEKVASMKEQDSKRSTTLHEKRLNEVSPLTRANGAQFRPDTTNIEQPRGDDGMSQSQGACLEESTEKLKDTVGPHQNKRIREEDQVEEAYQKVLSYHRDQMKLYEAKLKGRRDPSDTGATLNARLRMLKNAASMSEDKSGLLDKVAAMSEQDSVMYSRLIEGYASHRRSQSMGKTRLITNFKDHRELKRGAVFWTPICQRALNPEAKPDARRIPSPHGLIDDTKRMVVVIAVDTHHLRVCPVTTRNGNGAKGLQKTGSWACLQGPDVDDTENPGPPVFKVKLEGYGRRSGKISPSSMFKPDLPMEVQPPINYTYVGRLDTESRGRLPMPPGFDTDGNVLNSDDFHVDDRTTSMSQATRTPRQWDMPADSEPEGSRALKRQKTNRNGERYATSLTTTTDTQTSAAATTNSPLLGALVPDNNPQPSTPQDSGTFAVTVDDEVQIQNSTSAPTPTSGQLDRSQNTRRNTVQGKSRPRDGIRDRHSVRGDWDEPGHSSINNDQLNYD